MDTAQGFRKLCRRYNVENHAHELTFSCYRNREFLRSERVCEYLVNAIGNARAKHKFHLWAYVFMPNHVHILIWPTKTNYSISAIMQSIKQSVARKALRFLRQENPAGLKQLATGQKHSPYRFWQDGGGYDRNMTSTAALSASADYIHNNPVQKDLVSYPEDWVWSSAKEWTSGEQGVLSIDRESFLIA
jgi:putative transposase